MKSRFQRIRQTVARIDLPVALAVPALIGVGVVLAGVLMEQNGQLALAKTAGYAALDAYRATQAAMQLPLAQWMSDGIAGSLTSFGSNTQARGMALMFAAPLIAVATVLAARRAEA